jgi:pantoate--beta-alanine ligase
LGEDARQRALTLSRALATVTAAPASASEHRRTLREIVSGAGLDVIYADVVDPVTFAPSGDAESGDARALVAARIDGVRLIDNGPVVLKGEP